MKINDKYISKSDFDKLKQEDKDTEKRNVISDDAFALCDLMEEIKKMIQFAARNK